MSIITSLGPGHVLSAVPIIIGQLVLDQLHVMVCTRSLTGILLAVILTDRLLSFSFRPGSSSSSSSTASSSTSSSNQLMEGQSNVGTLD